MKIAYLMNIYPMTSTTFIRREILALERQGIRDFKNCTSGLGQRCSGRARSRRMQTHPLCPARRRAAAFASTCQHVANTSRTLDAFDLLGVAYGTARRSPGTVHLVYLAEACRIEILAAQGWSSASACTLRHQFRRGGDAGAFVRRAPLELHCPRSGGIRQGTVHRLGRENSALFVRGGD